MGKLDKLVDRANRLKESEPHILPFHVMAKGYCFSCKGRCLYEDEENMVQYSKDGYLVKTPNNESGLEDASVEELRAILKFMKNDWEYKESIDERG